MTSFIASSQRAKTTASAPAIASSTVAERAPDPSSSARAFAADSSLAATTTDSPPAARCRATAPPMLPTPMTAVLIPGLLFLFGLPVVVCLASRGESCVVK